MIRGDIYWVNFDPAVGSEIQKKRPAVIVSNDLNNKYMSRVQVLPITSNCNKVYPCEALIVVRNRTGKVLADQITTVDKSRLSEYIGAVNNIEMTKITEIIKIQLAI